MAQWFVPVLLLATLLVTCESASKKRENQYEINVRHGPFEIHQRHVNTKPFKRTNPNDEGAMDQLGYRKEASLSEEVVTEQQQQPKKEPPTPPKKHGDKKVRGSSVYRGQKKARHSWGYSANYGTSEFVTTTVRPFQKHGHRSGSKKKRRPHHSWDDDEEFKTLLSSERTKMEELAEKELMAGMKNFPFEKHIFPDKDFKPANNLKNHNMDENFFQRTTKAPSESPRFVTPTVLHNNPQLRVPYAKEKKGPVKFPATAKTTQIPATPAPVMTTQKPRKFQLPSSSEDQNNSKEEKDEIYLLVKYEKPKTGGKPNLEIVDNEIAKPTSRGRTRYASQKSGLSSAEIEETIRNVKLNSVEVTTPGYLVSESLESGERPNKAPTPQPLLGTTADKVIPNTVSGKIGPNQSGVSPTVPAQQDRLAQKYQQLQNWNQQITANQSQQPVQQPIQQNVQQIVTPAIPQPIAPTQATLQSPWQQNSLPTLSPSLQTFPSPNLQSIWSQNQQSFQNLQNQLNQQNLQNQNLFFQSLQNQQTNLLNRNRMAEALARQTSTNQPFFNQPNLPTFPSFPNTPTFPNQNLDFTGPMGNPIIPSLNQHLYPQSYFNPPTAPFSQNALNQHVFLGQSHNYMNSPQHAFTRSLMNSLSTANHLNPFLNQLSHSWNKPGSFHKPLNFQSLSQDFDNLIAKTKEAQNSNQYNANNGDSQPAQPQSFSEQNQAATTQIPPRSFQSFDFVNQQNKIPNDDRGSVKFNQESSASQQKEPQTFYKQNEQSTQQKEPQTFYKQNESTQQNEPQTFYKQNESTQQKEPQTFYKLNEQSTQQKEPQTFYKHNEQTSQSQSSGSETQGRNIELNAANSPANSESGQRQSQRDQTGPQQFPSNAQNDQPETSNQQQQQEKPQELNLPTTFLIPDHLRNIPPNQNMQQTVHQPDGMMVQHNAVRIRHQIESNQEQQPEQGLKLADQGDTRVQLDRSAKGSVEEPVGNSLQDSRGSSEQDFGGGLRDSYGQIVGEDFADYGDGGARRPDAGNSAEEEDSSLEELIETTDPLELSRMLVHRNGGLTVEQFNKLFRDYFDKDLTESDVHNLEEEVGTSGRSAGNELGPVAESGSQELGGDGEGDVPGSFEADDGEQNIRVQINKAGGRQEPIVKIGYGSSKSHQGVYKSPKFFEKLRESSSIEDDREEQWAPPDHLQEIAPSGVLKDSLFDEQSSPGNSEQQQENSLSENPTNSGHQGGLSYIKFEKFN